MLNYVTRLFRTAPATGLFHLECIW